MVVLIGIVLAVYLSMHPQIFRPKAASDATRAEFVDTNGNVISQTSSRNVILKLTYVPQSSGVSNTAVSNANGFACLNITNITNYGYGDLKPNSKSSDVDADLKAAASMGVKVVRVDAANDLISSSDAAARLSNFLDKAATYNISVIVALLDYYDGPWDHASMISAFNNAACGVNSTNGVDLGGSTVHT
ncbi:MAG: hypothetical protein ACHQVK_00185, partial [Candidatus Paceibacterales bacterium]